MLQAWTPTTSACYDLSTVFVANGLAPHAYGSTGRQNYHSSKAGAVRNSHSSNTKPHSNRKNHFHTNSSNNINNSSSAGVNVSTNGCSVTSTENIANNSRINAKHSTNSKTSIATNNGVDNGSNPSVGAVVDGVVIVSPSCVSTKIGASAQTNSSSSTKSHLSQSVEISSENNRSNSPQNNQRNKGRPIKRRDDNNSDSINSHYSSDSLSAGKPANTKILTNSGLNEPFDLKATSFPPLPSSVKSCSKENLDKEESVSASNHCSSLADVVKGTIKQRDNRCKLDNFDSNSCSFGKTQSMAANVHIVANPSFCHKLSKHIQDSTSSNTSSNTSSSTSSNASSNNTNSSLNSNQDISKSKTNSNWNLNQTSHHFDQNNQTNATIPAKTSNHCPLQPSSCLGYELLSSESSQENELKESNSVLTPTPVLNGINDTLSINSDSFDENNEHSSATQTQPSSPNSLTKIPNKSFNLFDTHQTQCNGRLDMHNEDSSGSIHDHAEDTTDSPPKSDQVCSKRLTYSEIAQRAQEKQTHDSPNPGSKDKESTSSNSSTSSKASAHLSSNSGRNKFSQSFI